MSHLDDILCTLDGRGWDEGARLIGLNGIVGVYRRDGAA